MSKNGLCWKICRTPLAHTVLLWIQVRKKLSSWLTISNLDSNLDFDLKQHSQAYFWLLLVRRIWRFNFWPKRNGTIIYLRVHASPSHGQTWLKIRSGLHLCHWPRRRLWWRSHSRSTPPRPPPPPRSALTLLTFALGPHRQFPGGVKTQHNNNTTLWRRHIIHHQFVKVFGSHLIQLKIWLIISLRLLWRDGRDGHIRPGSEKTVKKKTEVRGKVGW